LKKLRHCFQPSTGYNSPTLNLVANWIRTSFILGVRFFPETAFAAFALLSFVQASLGADRLSPSARADKVIVFKQQRLLVLLQGDRTIKTYHVALGGDPKGPKQQEGDHRTPEALYLLDRRNEHSRFYRSIHISYPNMEDRRNAAARGVSPGGDIMVHGLPNGLGWIGSAHRARDWTDGCIAVTNEEMDEIWRVVPDGTPIEIKP
jgi:murein L,D-transpeptidase YafK